MTLQVQLIGLSYFRSNADREHNWCVYGLHQLAAYARTSSLVRKRAQIQVTKVHFGDRYLGESGALEAPEAARHWLHFGADVLGLSCEPWSVEWVERTAATARRMNPAVRIWIGGDSVADLRARGRFHQTSRDLLFEGMGGYVEGPFQQVLEQLVTRGSLEDDGLRRIPGITWQPSSPESEVRNPPAPLVPLSGTPSPYGGSKPMPVDPAYDWVYVLASRGCRENCRYCSMARSSGLDPAPIRRIRREMQHARTVGCRRIMLWSAALNDQPLLMKKVLAELSSREALEVFSTMSLRRLTPELIRLVLEQPPQRFNFSFGVQSLAPKACRQAHRHHLELSAIRKTIAPLLGHAGVALDYIFPLPGETLDEFKRHVEYLLELPGIRLCINQLVLSVTSDFGRETARWGFTEGEHEGLRFARGCAGFPPEDVLRAKAWIASLAVDRDHLMVADEESWRSHCSRHSEDAP